MNNVLEIKNLSKKYGKEYFSLLNVSFSLCEGDSLFVYGKEGSGKTSLCDIISGLKDFDGDIKIFGKDRKLTKNQDMCISYISSKPVLFLHKTVRKNLEYVFEVLKKTDKQENKKMIEDAARLFGIYELLDEKTKKLNLEQKILVQLARSFVKVSKLLVVDIDKKGLDLGAQIRLFEALKLFASKRTIALLCVTDSKYLAKNASGKVAFLNYGSFYSEKMVAFYQKNPPFFDALEVLFDNVFVYDCNVELSENKFAICFCANDVEYKFFVPSDFVKKASYFDFDEDKFVLASPLKIDEKSIGKLEKDGLLFVVHKDSGTIIFEQFAQKG